MMDSAFEDSTLLPAHSDRAVNIDKATGEYIGTWLRQRNSLDAWRSAWSDERLGSFINTFIDARDDVVAQEGMSQARHRAKLKKETSMLITTKLESHREIIEQAVAEGIESVLEELRHGRVRDRASCSGRANDSPVPAAGHDHGASEGGERRRASITRTKRISLDNFGSTNAPRSSPALTSGFALASCFPVANARKVAGDADASSDPVPVRV